jgi:hypothetical protein
MASAHSLVYTALGNGFARASPSARCTVQASLVEATAQSSSPLSAMLRAEGKKKAPEGLHIAVIETMHSGFGIIACSFLETRLSST